VKLETLERKNFDNNLKTIKKEYERNIQMIDHLLRKKQETAKTNHEIQTRLAEKTKKRSLKKHSRQSVKRRGRKLEVRLQSQAFKRPSSVSSWSKLNADSKTKSPATDEATKAVINSKVMTGKEAAFSREEAANSTLIAKPRKEGINTKTTITPTVEAAKPGMASSPASSKPQESVSVCPLKLGVSSISKHSLSEIAKTSPPEVGTVSKANDELAKSTNQGEIQPSKASGNRSLKLRRPKKDSPFSADSEVMMRDTDNLQTRDGMAGTYNDASIHSVRPMNLTMNFP
jgi:hypothetical protein